MGTSQTVSVSPQVAAGSSIPVVLFPEFGYGCIDTLYGKAEAVLAVDANAGPDLFACYSDPVATPELNQIHVRVTYCYRGEPWRREYQ